MIRMLLSFLYREDIFHMGTPFPAFKKQKEGQSDIIRPALQEFELKCL
jgi:hypothetical protein